MVIGLGEWWVARSRFSALFGLEGYPNSMLFFVTQGCAARVPYFGVGSRAWLCSLLRFSR